MNKPFIAERVCLIYYVSLCICTMSTGIQTIGYLMGKQEERLDERSEAHMSYYIMDHYNNWHKSRSL
jgi:hypothetical protein